MECSIIGYDKSMKEKLITGIVHNNTNRKFDNSIHILKMVSDYIC